MKGTLRKGRENMSSRTSLQSMETLLRVALAVGLSALPLSGQESPGDEPVRLTNGRWFDGRGFVDRDFYVVDGVLVNKPRGKTERVVDLRGGFVIPPGAEAHNHNLERPWEFEDVVSSYIEAGVFYVKIQSDIGSLASKIMARLNQPTAVDAIFAHACLTGLRGHPSTLYNKHLRPGYETHLGTLGEDWFDGRAYFCVGSAQDLEGAWSKLAATTPDFIKVILSYSEDHAKNAASQSPYVRRGLDPQLLPWIVDKAHERGLTVSAHVETAFDFHVAVTAGVDEVSHLPGYYIHDADQGLRMKISTEDADLAAKRNVAVVSTTVLSRSLMRGRQERYLDLVRRIQKENLVLLQQKGVRILVGSDHSATSVPELMNLRDLGVFDNLTLLKMWCEETPRAIFPGRKIGRLEEGYEASSLVLRDDPLGNLDAVKTIARRFKQGVVLQSEPTTEARSDE